MKRDIRRLIEERLFQIKDELGFDTVPYFEVELPKIKEFGDYSTNVAMVMARQLKKNPKEIARIFIQGFNPPIFKRVEIAGPGFINLYLSHAHILSLLGDVAGRMDVFLSPKEDKKRKVMIEYVSANPTGPLHVGHGRGACIGSSLALILRELGHDVRQEFYINDAGAQVRNLGISILLRGKELNGEAVTFHEGCYMGDYVSELAQDFLRAGGSLDMSEVNIENASNFGMKIVLEWIENDLKDFGVTFDSFLSEKGLFSAGFVDESLAYMKEKKLTYVKDGALWFKSSDFGDDKDRVLIKENGEKTYFASDIAYHRHKFERRFDDYINIWGADHHGYVPRIKSALNAMGYNEKDLKIIMVQLVNLFRDGKAVTMSKRAGDFVMLREVLDEVGKDAMRFMFLTRKHDSPLDFDIELVKQKTSDNPVFYVQYMYARINSVFKVAEERGIRIETLPVSFDRLDLPEEMELINRILSFPDALLDTASYMEPHHLAYYLITTAQTFHGYYNACRFINADDMPLTLSRLNLLKLLILMARKGMSLLGIESPERM